MKTTFFLILTLIFNFKNLNAQNDGWREVGYGKYEFTNNFNVDKYYQFRFCGDSLDNIYTTNFRSTKNRVDIVKIDEVDIKVVKQTNYDAFYSINSDGNSGLFLITYEITDYYRSDKKVWFNALYHWNNYSERELYPSNLHHLIYRVFSNGDGNYYMFDWDPYPSNLLSDNGFLKKWNGKKWIKMDLEWYSGNGYGMNICADNSGNIYVSGNLNHTHDVNVAKYDGKNWMELGLTSDQFVPKGDIYSIITDPKGNLYAAGDFKDKHNKRYVAKWDGKEWGELGTGSESLNANGIIYSLAVDRDGNIYAAGAFTNSEHKHYVAKWDGAHWSEVGGGSGALNANKPIYSIFVNSRKSVFATGEFTNEKHNRYVAVYTQP